MAELRITIELGNEAMQNGFHVLQAIRESLRRNAGLEHTLTPRHSGKLMDGNGNGVGKWEVVEPEHKGPCILTGAEGENPDDCTTHDHEAVGPEPNGVVCGICSTQGHKPGCPQDAGMKPLPSPDVNNRFEGQAVQMPNGLTATFTREYDHTGRVPRPEKLWYLRCDECGEEIGDYEQGCDCGGSATYTG